MITFKPTRTDITLNELIVDGTLTLTGNYGSGTSHGDTVSFLGDAVRSTSLPTQVEVFEVPPAGTSATGYTYNFSPGANLSNGSIQLFLGATEYPQGTAYSAPLLAAVLRVRAFFPRV